LDESIWRVFEVRKPKVSVLENSSRRRFFLKQKSRCGRLEK